LMICSLFDALLMYLYLNLILMNTILVASVAYRRWYLCKSISTKG